MRISDWSSDGCSSDLRGLQDGEGMAGQTKGCSMTIITDDAFVRLFQERAGLEPDGWAGRDTLAMMDKLLPPKPSTETNAAAGEIPESYWPMLSKLESNDRLYALPPINPKTGRPYTSASGLDQFIKLT